MFNRAFGCLVVISIGMKHTINFPLFILGHSKLVDAHLNLIVLMSASSQMDALLDQMSPQVEQEGFSHRQLPFR